MIHFTFGKYIVVNENVPINATRDVKNITPYSSLTEEVKSVFEINEKKKEKNKKVTIIRLDSSPSFLKYDMILRL